MLKITKNVYSEEEGDVGYLVYIETDSYSWYIEDAFYVKRQDYIEFYEGKSNNIAFGQCNGEMSINIVNDHYEILLESYGQGEKGSITIKNKDIEQILNSFRELVEYGDNENSWYGRENKAS